MACATGQYTETAEREHVRFVSEHLRQVFTRIYRIVGNVATAQDLTQETFVKALRHADQLKDEQKTLHWLLRIAGNTAIDFIRRNRGLTWCEVEDTHLGHDASAEDVLIRAQQHEQLAAGLRLLTARERAAIIWRDVEGLHIEEVARRLECTKATVRSHIANGRLKLRRHIAGASQPIQRAAAAAA